ncbi:transcription factor 25 [Nephila pilipes]|uniref:Transcription factor 25 n=1 Tax=Nephila pilipes TaxID=299642 RepID=A0A8X6NV89_NEPPI|nr:transcription factor 25 [Nephila pilipes]
MSNRVLKKLHGEKDLATALGIDGMSESDDGGASLRGSVEKPINNRFELLNSVEHSLSDTEAKEDDDRENEPPQEGQERNKLEKQDSTHSTDSLKRKKKKKKKKLKSQKSTEENLDDAEDEVEASIRFVNKMLGEPETSDAHSSKQSSDRPPHEKSVLSVDLRSLNPDNEMKKIFGSKVVQNEQNKRRGRGRAHGRSTVLVSQKNWPHLGKPGLSMRLVETKDDIHYFAFEHSKQYQSIQLQFLEAVESFNPDNIVALLNTYPYHIDALIQFSDICRMGDDVQMAAELIERAIFYMECSLHPLFNIAMGNCRLDYRIAENRSFYIALFKHLIYIGQRGCNRTSLEFCKLLLSLDPEEDPLGVILMIDFYAIRSSQYEYLIKLYYEWNPTRNLFQLPNFAFSIALATYLLAVDDELPTFEADVMLQNALIMFPGFLLPMLNRCNVEPDKAVLSHSLFQRQSDPSALAQLISLYIGRMHSLWKAPDVIHWLERQVREVMERHKNCDPYFTESEEKKKLRYVGTPRNVLRHIILSDIRDATVLLPQDMMSSPIFGFDPLPPVDSISIYARPARPFSQEDRSVLGMFFRSLLPTFNAPREGGAEALREAGAQGGAEPRGSNDLRRSVTSLLDAMRDLISNIHLADTSICKSRSQVDNFTA